MLSSADFLAKFRFDTAENGPAKNLQNFAKFANFATPAIGDRSDRPGHAAKGRGEDWTGTARDSAGKGPPRLETAGWEDVYVFSNSKLERIFFLTSSFFSNFF